MWYHAEQIGARAYDESADVWALGCLLYEMCCLRYAAMPMSADVWSPGNIVQLLPSAWRGLV
jgi:serine/threonine protein kinase